MQLAHLNAFIGHGEFDTTLPVSWAAVDAPCKAGFDPPWSVQVDPAEY